MRWLTFCALCVAGSAQESVQFEAASVKLGQTREIGGVYTYPGGRVGLRGCTPRQLLEQAFDVQITR